MGNFINHCQSAVTMHPWRILQQVRIEPSQQQRRPNTMSNDFNQKHNLYINIKVINPRHDLYTYHSFFHPIGHHNHWYHCILSYCLCTSCSYTETDQYCSWPLKILQLFFTCVILKYAKHFPDVRSCNILLPSTYFQYYPSQIP